MQHLISQDIKAIARRTLGEIVPGGDVAALAEIIHPNLVDHDGPPGAPPGRDGMTWSMGMLQAAFSDRRWELHQVIAEDDTVVRHCTFHGRHTGQFLGLAPTSRSVAFRQVHILRFQDGKGSSTGPSPTTWTWPASSARSLARPANPFLPMPWPSCCRTCTRNGPLTLGGRARQRGPPGTWIIPDSPRGTKRRPRPYVSASREGCA
jgi:predicted ester cyclase